MNPKMNQPLAFVRINHSCNEVSPENYRSYSVQWPDVRVIHLWHLHFGNMFHHAHSSIPVSYFTKILVESVGTPASTYRVEASVCHLNVRFHCTPIGLLFLLNGHLFPIKRHLGLLWHNTTSILFPLYHSLSGLASLFLSNKHSVVPSEWKRLHSRWALPILSYYTLDCGNFRIIILLLMLCLLVVWCLCAESSNIFNYCNVSPLQSPINNRKKGKQSVILTAAGSLDKPLTVNLDCNWNARIEISVNYTAWCILSIYQWKSAFCKRSLGEGTNQTVPLLEQVSIPITSAIDHCSIEQAHHPLQNCFAR